MKSCILCEGPIVFDRIAKGNLEYHRCQDCGLFVQPNFFPREKYDESYFAKRSELRDVEAGFRFCSEALRIAEKLVRIKKIFEVGAGFGYLCQLAHQLGWEYEGIDFSPSAPAVQKHWARLADFEGLDFVGADPVSSVMLKPVIARSPEVGEGRRSNPGNAGSSAIEDSAIAEIATLSPPQPAIARNDNFAEGNSVGLEPKEFIALIHTFEHFRDPIAAAERLSQLVAPGGLLFIHAPNGDNAGDDENWFHFSEDHHFIYAPHHLSALFARFGFASLASYPVNDGLDLWYWGRKAGSGL